MVGYIEAAYHGGAGGQSAVIWNKGKRTDLFPQQHRAINEVLRRLGVSGKNGLDEFDTVGLGDHRNTGDWLD